MAIVISDRARRFLTLFEDETGASVRDCYIDDDLAVVAFVVEPGDMPTAIGPNGQHVERVREKLDRRVVVIEGADDAATFVANALAPAAVYHVTISENNDVVAYAEVDRADRGAAIGSGGRTIELARRLAARHFDVDDIQLA